MLTDEQVTECVSRYRREIDRFHKLTELVFTKTSEIVFKRLTIRAAVQRRTKDPLSFMEKLKQKGSKFNSVEDVFSAWSDFSGVRVLTYLESDRSAVVQAIQREFLGRSGKPVMPVKKDHDEGKGHYRATHCDVCIPLDELEGDDRNLENDVCEIQICSLMAHAFNEIEHDISYKPKSELISQTEVDLLNQLGYITRAGDLTIQNLLFSYETRMRATSGDFLDVYDFIARTRSLFPECKNFAENAGQLYEELIALNLNSPEKIIRGLLKKDEDMQAAAKVEMARVDFSEIPELFTADHDSSDPLMFLLFRTYADKIIENHPVGRGRGRPSRLVFFARRYRNIPTPTE